MAASRWWGCARSGARISTILIQEVTMKVLAMTLAFEFCGVDLGYSRRHTPAARTGVLNPQTWILLDSHNLVGLASGVSYAGEKNEQAC